MLDAPPRHRSRTIALFGALAMAAVYGRKSTRLAESRPTATCNDSRVWEKVCTQDLIAAMAAHPQCSFQPQLRASFKPLLLARACISAAYL